MIININNIFDIFPQRIQWGDDEEEATGNVECDMGVEMDMMTASELDKYDDAFDDEEEEVSEAENKV